MTESATTYTPDRAAKFMRAAPPAERLFNARRHVGALRDQYRVLRVAVATHNTALMEQAVDAIGAIIMQMEHV